MLLLRLNRHLIPGFAEVVKQLEALKAKCDIHAAVSVAAQNAREGDFVHVRGVVSLHFCRDIDSFSMFTVLHKSRE